MSFLSRIPKAFAVLTGRKIAADRRLPAMIAAGYLAALKAKQHQPTPPTDMTNDELAALQAEDTAAAAAALEKLQKINQYLGTLPALFDTIGKLLAELKQQAGLRGVEKAAYERRIQGFKDSQAQLAALIGTGADLVASADAADDTFVAPPVNPTGGAGPGQLLPADQPHPGTNPPVDPSNPPPPAPAGIPNGNPPGNEPEVPRVPVNGDGTFTDPATGDTVRGDGTNSDAHPVTGDPVVDHTTGFPAHPPTGSPLTTGTLPQTDHTGLEETTTGNTEDAELQRLEEEDAAELKRLEDVATGTTGKKPKNNK